MGQWDDSLKVALIFSFPAIGRCLPQFALYSSPSTIARSLIRQVRSSDRPIAITNIVDKILDLWIGIGAQSSASRANVRSAIGFVCERYGLDFAAIIGLATLDRKATELELFELCCESGWLLKTYLPSELAAVNVSSSSSSALAAVGTPSVAEAAALAAAQTDSLLIPKQKYRPHDRGGWITIAIAQAW